MALITEIKVYSEKHDPGKALEEAELIEGGGIGGDYHNDISLYPLEAKRWILAQKEQGLCFKRFKGNILTEDIPLEDFVPGKILSTGEAQIQISDEVKQCFPTCPLYQQGKACVLKGKSFFAKVIKGGLIHKGDRIEAANTRIKGVS